MTTLINRKCIVIRGDRPRQATLITFGLSWEYVSSCDANVGHYSTAIIEFGDGTLDATDLAYVKMVVE